MVWSQLAESRPQTGGTFFVHEDGSCLLRFQFVAIFRKCLGAVGLDPKQYGSHSFRIVAATEASRWGLDDATVNRIGMWESNRYRLYVRPHLL